MDPTPYFTVLHSTHCLSMYIVVYRKGDIVMEPMNSRDVLPKNVPGVGEGVCHVGVGVE